MKKNILITGGSGGIGKAIILCLKKEYNIISISKSYSEEINDICQKKCDLSNEGETKKILDEICSTYKVDVLINTIGIIETKPILDITYGDFARSSISFIGPFLAIKYILPYMVSNKNGYIINIGSMRSDIYAKDKCLYSVMKSALKAFTGTLKEEYSQYGIKSTLISPGAVNTNFYKKDDWKSRDYITQPEDIAKAVLFLLSLSEGAEVSELVIGKLYG